jgi:hypothetical protein
LTDKSNGAHQSGCCRKCGSQRPAFAPDRCRLLAPLRPAEICRECLFNGIDRKWPPDGQNGANDPQATSRLSSQTGLGRGRLVLPLPTFLRILRVKRKDDAVSQKAESLSFEALARFRISISHRTKLERACREGERDGPSTSASAIRPVPTFLVGSYVWEEM